jgi:hypothetical protein
LIANDVSDGTAWKSPTASYDEECVPPHDLLSVQ